MNAEELFKGTALVIDDELGDENSQIVQIVKSIQDNGGNVIGREKLPEPEADLMHFVGTSFVVMDWNLEGELTVTEGGEYERVALPKGVVQEHDKLKLAFIENLAKCRLAPIFIFTAGPLEDVEKRLSKHPTLSYSKDHPSHILVKSKSEVIEKGLFTVLGEWLNATPSALALKTWEREYERAKNDAFLDFYTKSIYWPVMLWDTFVKDQTPASDELGRLITRIIFSRMTPFKLDMTPFLGEIEEQQANNRDAYRADLLKVLQAERFVHKTALHDDSIAPGDVFKNGKRFHINIRPDCDCIAREAAASDAIELYLLEGRYASNRDLKDLLERERGLLREREDQAAVFAMYDGRTVVFGLKDLQKQTWGEMKDRRIGRLLPPFLTRLQQRYAAYLQRPGLPKIPAIAMPEMPDLAAAGLAVASPAAAATVQTTQAAAATTGKPAGPAAPAPAASDKPAAKARTARSDSKPSNRRERKGGSPADVVRAEPKAASNKTGSRKPKAAAAPKERAPSRSKKSPTKAPKRSSPASSGRRR